MVRKAPISQSLRSGLLLINKPVGMVSKDVSRKITGQYGWQKIGHIGTLDPMAEGVLPILFGRATRLQDLLLNGRKTYRFTLQLGVETDTLDRDGEIIKTQVVPSNAMDKLPQVQASLVGNYEQEPPIYSAIKFKGKPLYYYARAGRASEIPLKDLSKNVQIFSLNLLRVLGEGLEFEVCCSKGTYVRSLARDIAKGLGTIGNVTRIVRVESSGFALNQAFPIEVIEKGFTYLDSLIIPIHNIPLGIPSWVPDCPETVAKLWNGKKISVTPQDFDYGFVDQGVIGRSHTNLLFLDENRHAMGIGESRLESSGRIQISLKRGLL